MKPVERLPVYENLFAWNRDSEQVLIDIAQLQELGVFQCDLSLAFDGEAPDILRIVGGLAPVQDPGHPPDTGKDPCAVQGSTVPGQMLEAEDEFERDRR